MKRNLFVFTGVFFSLMLSSSVFADSPVSYPTTPSNPITTPASATAAAPTTMGTAATSVPGTPCKNIATACKSAGKGTTRREVWRTCIKPILDGQSVTGVTVNDADVQACKAKMQAHKKS